MNKKYCITPNRIKCSNLYYFLYFSLPLCRQKRRVCASLESKKNVPITITKTFGFEAAHYLPMMPEGHKCRRMHGHSFRIEVKLAGEPDAQTGILMDFAEIKTVVKPLIEMLDHWVINEVGEQAGSVLLQNPTSENLAKWFYETLKPLLPQLHAIVVHETCTSKCEYTQ